MLRRALPLALCGALALAAALRGEAGSPAGVNLHAPEAARAGFLFDRTVEAGLGWVRIDFVWAAVEPEPGVELWRPYDELVAAARARGLAVLAIVAYTPRWATAGPEISGVPRRVSDWSDFCYRAAERYRGGIDHWEIWNEPNLSRFWAGSRAEYVERILLPAARALRAGNPDARIGGPALSHRTGDGRDWHGWLLEVLAAAGGELDFLTHHLYDLENPDGVFARLAGTTPFGREPARWGEAAPSLTEVLAVAGWVGPVWLTETGWTSTRLDESFQAERYARFLARWPGAGSEPPWPEKVFFYELEDDRDPQVAKYGLLRPGGRPKPAFFVVRDALAGPPPSPSGEEPEEPGGGRGPRKPPPG